MYKPTLLKPTTPAWPGSLYGLGEISSYPCGCVFQTLADGYHHYLNPACKAQHGISSDRYEVTSWSAAPPAVKKAYGWLVTP